MREQVVTAMGIGDGSRRDVLRTIGALGLGSGALSMVGSATPGPKPKLPKRDAKKAARRIADQIGLKEEYSDWRGQVFGDRNCSTRKSRTARTSI